MSEDGEYKYQREFWWRLPHWLKHITWKKRDATLLICGILPEPFCIPPFEDEFYFHTSHLGQTLGLEQYQRDELQDKVNDVARLWDSDPEHADDACVDEWIRWALDNDFYIDWLDWAIDEGLIKNIHGNKQETPEERVLRLKSRKIQLQNEGVRNFNVKIAEEEGVSVARVKQLIGKS